MSSSDQELSAFDTGVAAWIEYNESPSGKLRHAVILNHLRKRLAPSTSILDAGGGTGELAADLARETHRVTLLDSSNAMMEQARRRCHALDVKFVCADVSRIDELFSTGEFDAVLCHSLIEFVTDPPNLLWQIAHVLRPGGTLSLVFGNRCHAPLRLAIVDKDLLGARDALDDEAPCIDLFGLPRRTYYPEKVRQMIETSGFKVIGEYGVRVFADLIGDDKHDWSKLLELELSASARMPYRQMARFIQLIAEKP